jgi:hypothetical protein
MSFTNTTYRLLREQDLHAHHPTASNMHTLILKFVSCLRIDTTEVESVGLATQKTRPARRG